MRLLTEDVERLATTAELKGDVEVANILRELLDARKALGRVVLGYNVAAGALKEYEEKWLR